MSKFQGSENVTDHTKERHRIASGKSPVTNGSQRLLFGDGRSAGARRYRDLIADFAAEAGGMAALSASGKQTVRSLAQVCVELEILEAHRASGQAIDPVAFVTLVNSQRRLLRDLEKLKAAAPARKKPDLQDHLQRTYGPKAAVPA